MRPANRSTSLYFDYPRYPFRKPPEMDGERLRHAVVIVGAGPVGVTAALELARHGISCVVLDDKDTVNDGSRAICISRHSLEILQQLELADIFVDKALPWTHGTSYYHEKPVFRLEMPHSENERFFPMYNLQQQYIEKFLIDKASEDEKITLRWQNRVTGINADDDSIELFVTTPEGDYTLYADYLLAADGARSVVRRRMGLSLNGDAYEGRYVIVDIQMQSDYPTERRAFFDPTANPGETILVHKQPDNIWRLDYQLAEGDDGEEALKEENIRAKIAAILDMIGETGAWDLEWWSLYKAYTLALDDYRHGRVIFIGDAAHLVPIFGVRGLNNGLADAINAAWKLAYVIHGWTDEKLLDSYSPERRGATLDVFRNASKSTRFMTPPTRGHMLMREAALSLALSREFTRPLINPRQVQPYTYSGSPLTSFKNRDREFTAGPVAGAPLINHKLADDDYLLDYLGPGFSGLYFTEAGEINDELLDCFSKLDVGTETFMPIIIAKSAIKSSVGIVLCDTQGGMFMRYGAQQDTFYLVRPDRHICARWRSIHLDEVNSAFNQSLGRL